MGGREEEEEEGREEEAGSGGGGGDVGFHFLSGYYLPSHFQHYARLMGIHKALCVNNFWGLCPKSLFSLENVAMDLFLFCTP